MLEVCLICGLEATEGLCFQKATLDGYWHQKPSVPCQPGLACFLSSDACVCLVSCRGVRVV
jgi:hypothetical protein